MMTSAFSVFFLSDTTTTACTSAILRRSSPSRHTAEIYLCAIGEMDVDTVEDIGAPAERANAQAGLSSRQITNEGSSNLDAMLSLLDAHTMRVTRGGQIRHYVQFALKFLDVCPCVFPCHVHSDLGRLTGTP